MDKKLRPSRRQFLRLGTAALAGGILLPHSACRSRPGDKPARSRKLTYRTLGRTGLKLPVVSMGTNYEMNLVKAALDSGIVYIHTSGGYPNHERQLADVFKGRRRDSFVIATSPDLPYEGHGRSLGIGKKVDPGVIAGSLELSLKNMGLDHVDIYYLGSFASREAVLFEPYLEAYDRLKQAGKTRFAGVATHENEPEVIRAATDSRFWDVVLTAYNFRQSYRREVKAAIGRAAAAGLGVVAMKTQAGVYWDRFHTRKINMKAALKWVLRDQNVHTAIPAFSNFDELEEDLDIMSDLTMTPEEERDLRLGDELGLTGCYCQHCGHCLAQCPAGLDIPTLMRGYMYAYGYREPIRARRTVQSISAADIPCRACQSCSVRCALGHDVKTRLLDIARLRGAPDESQI